MEQPKRTHLSTHVQSVERALLLLNLLAKEQRDMQLTEISKKLDWPKSTVHGLLSTLREYEYISQSSETGKYGLGIRLFELGNVVARGWEIRSAALPHLQRLGKALSETVHLATDVNGEVLYIEKLDYAQGMRIVSETGARLPMHCSGLGKVLLAHKSPAEIKRIIRLRGLPAQTERTITTPERLMEELREVRENGYAIDDREIMDGLRCVAAPVRNSEGRVQYAVSVSALARNMEQPRLDATIREVTHAAAEISRAMGYRV